MVFKEPVKQGEDAVSSYALILANVLAVIGVLFWDWSVGNLILYYWLESLVIGIYNIVKMLISTVHSLKIKDNFLIIINKLFSIPFFCVHYGIFMFVHLMFIITIFFTSSFV